MTVKKNWYYYFFIITAGFFLCSDSTVISLFYPHSMRWVFLLLLLFSALCISGLVSLRLSTLGVVAVVYFVWCVLTSFWSIVPFLSQMKSVMFLLTALTLYLAIRAWQRGFSWQYSLDWLWGVLIITTLSILGGSGHYDLSSSFSAYQGLVFNPNTLAFMINSTMVLLLWKRYQLKANQRKRHYYTAAIVILAYFLLITHCRSELLSFLITCFFYFLGIRHKIAKKGKVLILLLLLSTFLILSSTTIYPFIMQAFIYKGTSGLLNTRMEHWLVSYQHALQGGWFGIGFGGNAGETTFNMHSLGAGSYGREKANSQLAVIEETGLVGFGIYLLLLWAFFSSVIRSLRSLKLSQEKRVLLYLIIGAILGLLAESTVEDWWGSPGSGEFFLFWGLVVTVLVLLRRFKREITIEYTQAKAPTC